MAGRTQRLLERPIVPTLLGLAAPNVLVMVVQAAVTVADAFYVGRLGAHALAGVSLVFPVVMLMQTMSAGGMGGGVSSAVARALGGRRRDDANALAVHALVIAVGMSLVFTIAVLGGGPRLYRAMGGSGAALDAAVEYSTVVFAGAVAPWLLNIMSSVVRGTGNMALPATVTVVVGVVHLGLSPALVFGLGGLPPLGVAGAGLSMVLTFGGGAAFVIGYLLAGRALVTLRPRHVRLRARLFAAILEVGAPASVNNILSNGTVLVLTGLVGQFGTLALAGYGMGTRLEYLMIPLVFGFGSALVAMVGTNVGAGNVPRAERIAWTGGALAAGLTGIIGLTGALAPNLWVDLFTRDRDVIEAGATYLRIVGPGYGFFGLGLALYFASQGAGRLFWPVTASLMRLGIALAGGWLAIHVFHGGIRAVYVVMLVSLVIFGAINAVAVAGGVWRRGRPSTP
jgi:putative MATE family efflux protein